MKCIIHFGRVAALSLLLGLGFVLAWEAQAAAPNPSVTLNVPSAVRIGDPLAISATFDNTSTDSTGYGPFIDIAVDTTGADGFYPGTPAPLYTYDGISVNASGAVTYLGVGLNYQVLTLDDTANGGLELEQILRIEFQFHACTSL